MRIRNLGLYLNHKYADLKVNALALVQMPSQTAKERKLFRSIFEAASFRDPLRIFEWGSGYSTTYYAKFLQDIQANYEWHSVDNDPQWFLNVKKAVGQMGLGGRVKTYLRTNRDEYVNIPYKLGKFDLFIIDGRFRRRCMEAAKGCLKLGGMVILHDAQRKHYHCGMAAYGKQLTYDGGKWYPSQEDRSVVWIGMDPIPDAPRFDCAEVRGDADEERRGL